VIVAKRPGAPTGGSLLRERHPLENPLVGQRWLPWTGGPRRGENIRFEPGPRRVPSAVDVRGRVTPKALGSGDSTNRPLPQRLQPRCGGKFIFGVYYVAFQRVCDPPSKPDAWDHGLGFEPQARSRGTESPTYFAPPRAVALAPILVAQCSRLEYQHPCFPGRTTRHSPEAAPGVRPRGRRGSSVLPPETPGGGSYNPGGQPRRHSVEVGAAHDE
jgi:hypothetical protein